jgi:hypothetical protein
MRRSRRTTLTVLIGVAALLCASMLAPAFGAPEATSAASLAKKLARTLKIAKRADRNAKRAIAGLQVEGKQGPVGPPGATGAAGQPGAAGAKGDKGDPATRLWVVVTANGTPVRGSGAISSAKTATGRYEVVFNRDVTACSDQATMSISPGEVVAQPLSGVPSGVFVATYTSAGSAADKAFQLAVFC